MSFLEDLIGGKQRVVPTSSSESEAFQRSSSGSVSSGGSTSTGTSRSLAQSISDVFGGDTFKALFGNASNAAGRASELVPGLQGTASMLFDTGGRFLDQLEGGTETAARLNDTGVEDAQIGQLQSDLGRFFSEEINPRITSRGVATGTFGGSRGEVAQGAASRALAEEFVRGSTSIRQSGVDRRDRLATSADTLNTARAGQGISAIPSLFGLAEAGAGAELAPYLQLSQILGGPTVLTQSSSRSSSDTSSVASQLAQAFSESIGQSTSKSQGSTVTKGPGLLDVLDTLSKFAA